MKTWKWENHSKKPGPFHVTKMKDANTRWKDKHEGKRRYHENVSFSLRISVYLESVTQLTHRVLFPETLRNKEECKKTIVTRRIQTIELLQQEITEKKAVNAGSKHYHTCKKSRVQHSTNHECVWAKCFSWNKESFFLRKWAIIIISKVLFNFVLIHSKFSIYKNILA